MIDLPKITAFSPEKLSDVSVFCPAAHASHSFDNSLHSSYPVSEHLSAFPTSFVEGQITLKGRIIMKKIAAIAIAAVLVLALTISAVAASGTIQANITYRNIKVLMNGEELVLADSAGNSVEPFIMNGTTYLPLRVVASALGLSVGWDDTTSTVSLTEKQVDNFVYITRTGSKYHYDDTCNGGTYWAVPYDSAIGMGLGACNKCVH